MSEKNSSYKLDFSYKTKFSFHTDEVKYSLEELLTFRRHWRKNFDPFLRDVLREYEDSGNMAAYCTLAKTTVAYNEITDHVFRAEVDRALAIPKMFLDEHVRYANSISWSTFQTIEKIACQASMLTPEFKKVEEAFTKWLKRREGVVKAWKLFADEHNKKVTQNVNTYYNAGSPVPTDVTLQNLSEYRTSRSFRRHLETNRPDKFYPGMVVALKSEYLDKRGKDPLYYNYDKELKAQPRVGTIVEQKDELMHGSIGEGSRALRVCWFSTGEETNVMERCLEVHEI